MGNFPRANDVVDPPRPKIGGLSFAAVTGGHLGDTFDDIDLDDARSVWRVAQRLLRYDPNTGWIYWAYLTAPKGATPEQVIHSTRATFYAGPGKLTGYVTLGARRFTAARVVWLLHKGVWPSERLRHRNGNPSDDRMENLSDQPKPKVKKERAFKRKHPVGVCPMGPSHWQAYVAFKGQRKFLGRFKTQEEAIKARADYDAGLDLI